ncbi:MAG TPA: DUF1579 domain-containing protein [Allosphingosinicella sp.]|jgi:hypothetical protein
MKTLLITLALSSSAVAQAPAAPVRAWDPAARIAAQRNAMKALAFLDGEWRGTVRINEMPEAMTHTERVGTLLDGTIRLVEGRAYDKAGKTGFNAFAIISYDPAKRVYSMRSHAMGFVGDYPLTVRPDGFSWSHPAGPGAEMRYTATVKGGEWHEVGERVAKGAEPVKTIDLRVRKLGPSLWPEAGAVRRR